MVSICNIEPFRYKAVPQPEGAQGASSNQINEQSLENYLSRFRDTICADLQAIEDRLSDLEARISALETP